MKNFEEIKTGNAAKTHILISTIVRDRAEKLPNYFSQILNFVENLKGEYDFSISIYENDSTDESKLILSNQDFSYFKEHFVKCENIGTDYYGSIVNEQRVINYANARNKTLENLDLSKYDWLMIIEPDVIYDFESAKEIITRSQAPNDVDVYSGVLVMNSRPYDLWGMRRSEHEEWGGVFPDYITNPVREFWSTANGFCLYKAKPFQDGLEFSSFNKRLSKHDCDTAVLCEDLRSMGHDRIFINQSIPMYHEKSSNTI